MHDDRTVLPYQIIPWAGRKTTSHVIRVRVDEFCSSTRIQPRVMSSIGPFVAGFEDLARLARNFMAIAR